jgi:hypothetical protein
MLASRERRETSIALTSTLHWFETEVLAEERNYRGLVRHGAQAVSLQWPLSGNGERQREFEATRVLTPDGERRRLMVRSWRAR